MKKIYVAGMAAAALLCSSLVHAEGVGVTAKVGTLGLGLQLTAGFSPVFNGRLGFNNYTYNYSTIKDNINYDVALGLKSGELLLDLHPFAGGFRVTGGAMYNKNALNLTATPAGTYSVGNNTYTAAQVGTLTGVVDFNKVAPYFGIGWGNAVEKGDRFSFAMDLGVMLQGAPKAVLSANGPVTSLPTFKDDLAREEANLNASLKEFKYYPVASVGIGYHF